MTIISFKYTKRNIHQQQREALSSRVSSPETVPVPVTASSPVSIRVPTRMPMVSMVIVFNILLVVVPASILLLSSPAVATSKINRSMLMPASTTSTTFTSTTFTSKLSRTSSSTSFVIHPHSHNRYSYTNGFTSGRKHCTIPSSSLSSKPSSKPSSSLFATNSNNHNQHQHQHNHNHHHHQSNNNKSTRNKGILSHTARESAVIVEWEPVSELERRIEDGIHYEHYDYDPLLDYGSEEKRRIRKEWKEKKEKMIKEEEEEKKRKQEDDGNDIEDDDDECNDNEHESENENEKKRKAWSYWNKNQNIQKVDGVFCGMTVTKEEIERLKSANPDDDQWC